MRKLSWIPEDDLDDDKFCDRGGQMANEIERNLRSKLGDGLYEWLDAKAPGGDYWFKPGNLRVVSNLQKPSE